MSVNLLLNRGNFGDDGLGSVESRGDAGEGREDVAEVFGEERVGVGFGGSEGGCKGAQSGEVRSGGKEGEAAKMADGLTVGFGQV